ncbi:NfeD family protein [Caulobacter sp. LjRoot300]|uniref:NfeD family protein n=1 Tax=Caulobacter sp. LjRoot300 TaxID=3342321 RepID=UPI003ECD1FAF
MHGLMAFYATHPFWVWLAVAAIFLAVEVATGTGWLLWPAAAGLVVGLLTLVLRLGAPLELGLFAVLTIAATYLARRFLKPVLDAHNPDLNDPSLRLVGRDGEVLDGFHNGKGRVFVDGKEWAAVVQDGEPPAAGQKVLVVAVDGAVLTVR